MSEQELRGSLASVPLPDEAAAEERSRQVVRSAFASREPVRWTRRRRGLVVAVAAASLVIALVLVAVLTPPGQAVVDRFRDAVGRETTLPALERLPAPGRLLVLSSSGPWVVQEDGSKRLLGDYGETTWSPRGLYVAAAQGQHLVALDSESGDVRWALARSLPVHDPSWSGGGLDTRIAYRAGSDLHVVAGDGSPDSVLAEGIAPVPVAWQGDSHTLAYVSANSRVHVADADSRRELWRTGPVPGVRKLVFFGDRLVAVSPRAVTILRPGHARRLVEPPAGHRLLDAVVLAGGEVLYADYDPGTDTTALYRSDCAVGGNCLLIQDTRVFQGAGRLEGLAPSPDGRWVVVGWPAADQLLFLRLAPRIGNVVAVSGATGEFSPGHPAGQAFPLVAGWAP